MKNSQRGSVSLLALLFASFLMSLGGAGAAASYFQKNPDEFMAQLHTYFASRIDAAELAPLDTTPTPTGTVTPTPTDTLSPTPTPTPTGTPTTTITPTPPSVHISGDDEDETNEDEHESQEELHESIQGKIHENEQGEHTKIKLNVRSRGDAGLSFVYKLRNWLVQNYSE